MKRPLIANIKRNALDDGPGIRTTIFFKGCPLDCVWCHNPECISAAHDLIWRGDRCIACSTCLDVCKPKAIKKEETLILDREVCDYCGECAEECPPAAWELIGKRYAVEALIEIALKDRMFFANSGGGVTLSGGEPTLYLDYAAAVAKMLREQKIHILVETCGQFDWERFEERLLPHLDTVWVDLKIRDPEDHQKYCGRDNATILANIENLTRADVDLLVRIPLIPKITATDENLEGVARMVKELGHERIGVIAYNPLFVEKARGLGKVRYDRETWLTPEEKALCRSTLEAFNLEIIGDL